MQPNGTQVANRFRVLTTSTKSANNVMASGFRLNHEHRVQPLINRRSFEHEHSRWLNIAEPRARMAAARLTTSWSNHRHGRKGVAEERCVDNRLSSSGEGFVVQMGFADERPFGEFAEVEVDVTPGVDGYLEHEDADDAHRKSGSQLQQQNVSLTRIAFPPLTYCHNYYNYCYCYYYSFIH